MVIGLITTSYRQYFKVPDGEKVDYWTFLFLLFVTKATQYYMFMVGSSKSKEDVRRPYKEVM